MKLSRREVEVLRLAADGYTSREIGQQLHISPETVKCQLKSAYRKLQARNRAHAVAILLREEAVV